MNTLEEYFKNNPYSGNLFKGIRENDFWNAYEIYFEEVPEKSTAYNDTSTNEHGYSLFRSTSDNRVVGIRLFKDSLSKK